MGDKLLTGMTPQQGAKEYIGRYFQGSGLGKNSQHYNDLPNPILMELLAVLMPGKCALFSWKHHMPAHGVFVCVRVRFQVVTLWSKVHGCSLSAIYDSRFAGSFRYTTHWFATMTASDRSEAKKTMLKELDKIGIRKGTLLVASLLSLSCVWHVCRL
jgi:hypothetical protein